MTSARLASVGAVLVLLAPSPARAQTAPPDPASPGVTPAGATPAGPPPGAYAPPPGWSPSAALPPWYPTTPYTPMKRRSPGMIGLGVVLVSLSTVGVIAGTALFVASNNAQPFLPTPCCGGRSEPSDPSGLKTPGIVSIAFGVAAMAAGLPLLIVGSQKVPDRGEAGFVPTVRVGAGGGTLGWRF